MSDGKLREQRVMELRAKIKALNAARSQMAPRYGSSVLDDMVRRQQATSELIARAEATIAELQAEDGPHPVTNACPPAWLEVSLAFITPHDQREGLLGDMAETFQRDCEAKGRQRAVRIYAAGVARSFVALFLQRLRDLGIVAFIAKWISS